MSPQVLWLVTPQQQLRASLAAELAVAMNDEPYNKRRDRLDNVLRQTFPRASSIVVQERLLGFRAKENFDILLVDVFPAPRPPRSATAPDRWAAQELWRTDPRCYIVKIGDPEKLQREWQGWKLCRPPGLYGDSILCMLRPGAFENRKPLSLIYGEGQAILGDAEATDLERAFIECCRFGVPSLKSLQQGIRRLFNRLSRRFYRASFVTRAEESLSARPAELLKRVQKGLARWQDSLDDTDPTVATARTVVPAKDEGDQLRGAATDEERRRFRRIAVRALAECRTSFIDPCDYMQFLLRNPREAARILCGCSHGDLHGRNILVNRMQDDVGSLYVFDYEDMRRDNPIGWDPVKMETELKIRVYPHLFQGTLEEFAKRVHDFEVVLVQRTELIHDIGTDRKRDKQGKGERPRVPGGRAGERLARLVLTIREQAKRHLGTLRHRQRDWLEEYYFLLLCYGCGMPKISSYEQRHLTAGFVAAGVAARRLHYPQTHFDGQIEEARLAAERRKNQIRRTSEKNLDKVVLGFCRDRAPKAISYHACLEFVKVWSRAGRDEGKLLKAAVMFLEELRQKCPHVLEIEEELVLVLLEIGGDIAVARAQEILRDVERRYPYRQSDEILSRNGRLAKEEGVLLWGPNRDRPSEAAVRCFQKSADIYRQAYERRGSYYPAVNTASLKYLISAGNPDTVREELAVAEAALRKSVSPPDSEDALWEEATSAEIRFLKGAYEDAATMYRSAARHQRSHPQAQQSMLRQLRLLLRVAPERGKQFWTDAKQIEVFGREAFEAVVPVQERRPPMDPNQRTPCRRPWRRTRG